MPAGNSADHTNRRARPGNASYPASSGVTGDQFSNAAAPMNRGRASGIAVPIIPGLKMVSSVRQLTTLPKHFHVNFPDELVDEMLANKPHAAEIGRRWAHRQVTGLVEAGVPCVHFYVMNDAAAVVELIRGLD